VEAKEHDDQEKKELFENSHNSQLQLFFCWQE
jgi:hypothetical protein